MCVCFLFAAPASVNMRDDDWKNPTIAATALKQYLLEMPSSVIPPEKYEDFIIASSMFRCMVFYLGLLDFVCAFLPSCVSLIWLHFNLLMYTEVCAAHTVGKDEHKTEKSAVKHLFRSQRIIRCSSLNVLIAW